MSKTWYMTVGLPGGELAVQSDDAEMAWERLRLEIPTYCQWAEEVPEAAEPPISIRPCPPGIAEWLDADPFTWDAQTGTACNFPSHHRHRMPGGWIHHGWGTQGHMDKSTYFIPVPHTANITVLEAEQ